MPNKMYMSHLFEICQVWFVSDSPTENYLDK